MDIERTMQFIVENLAAVSARLEKMAERQGRVEDRQAELAAEFMERMMQSDERHERQMSAIRDELHRAIRFSVEEHPRERVRRHELEAEMKAGMDELRKSLQRFLDRSGNGHQAA